QDSDIHRAIRHFQIDPARLAKDVTESLDRLPRGSTSVSDLSSHVEEAVERGWVMATLMFKDPQVRTGYLAIGMLKTPSLRNALLGVSREFDKVKLDTLTDQFDQVVGSSPEGQMRANDGSQFGGGDGAAATGPGGEMAPAQMGKHEALKRFTVDMTEQARSGKMDPIVGRDEEIRQIIDVLMRRRQNNPTPT